jgi:hypothetical protein
MGNYDKYLYVCHKLRQRYTEKGRMVISVGGVLRKYSRLEDMEAVKYLGCDPNKLKRSGF